MHLHFFLSPSYGIQLSAQRERISENEAASTTAANNINLASKLMPNINLANGSNLATDDNQLISRRHSSEILVSIGNENYNQNHSNEASNGYVCLSHSTKYKPKTEQINGIFIFFLVLSEFRNAMRQLSADSITMSHTMAEAASTPSGSHISLLNKSTNESSKRAHATPNAQQPQQIQKQLGNVVSDINSLALENKNSQQKTSQQQNARPNQTASGNQTTGIGTSNSNANGNCVQSISHSSNMTWQQTSPNTTNGTAKTPSTENNASGKNC